MITNIDCGASDSTLDDDWIYWIRDDDMSFSNSVSRVVQSSNLVPTVMDTLRVFTGQNKNCYYTPITKGQKVLVRASFNYGNYDGLSNPPTFDLHFDGNFWTTVHTSIKGVKTYEATYIAKTSSVSVCVAQTIDGQFPFMSALQFSELGPEMYSEVDENRALFLINRFAYGASQTVRYNTCPSFLSN